MHATLLSLAFVAANQYHQMINLDWLLTLQAWKAQQDPLLVDPEFRKIMARPLDEASSSAEACGTGSVDINISSSGCGEAVVYELLRMLKVVYVVAAAGFIAGERVLARVWKTQF